MESIKSLIYQRTSFLDLKNMYQKNHLLVQINLLNHLKLTQQAFYQRNFRKKDLYNLKYLLTFQRYFY